MDIRTMVVHLSTRLRPESSGCTGWLFWSDVATALCIARCCNLFRRRGRLPPRLM